MYYAVIQEGHGVYGVGETEDKAISSSSRLGTPGQIWAALVPQDQALHGDILIVECTPALFHQVTAYGFEPEFEYTENGVADIDRSPRANPVELEQYAG